MMSNDHPGDPLAAGLPPDKANEEEALRQSEAHFRALYRATPAMMHSIDGDGNIVDVSELWLSTLGYTSGEVIGHKSWEFLTEESRDRAIETVLPEFFHTGTCRDIPYRIVAKDGRILDVLLSATCERTPTGEIARSLAVMQDVTDSLRAKRELKAAKDYAENLIRTASVMVVELDLSGNLKQLNAAAEQVTGYRLDEIRGRQWFGTVMPRDRYPQAWTNPDRLLASGASNEFENPILTKAGDERYIVWRNSPVIENGTVVGTLSVGIDVTEKKAMERRLALSEALLKEAQSVAHFGSWVLDHATGELTWSDEIFRILGIDREHVGVSKDAFLSVLHPDDRADVKRAYKQSLGNHRPYEIRHRLLMPDGEIKYIHQRSETTFDHNGAPIRTLGAIQDITLTVLQEMTIQESEERFRTIADYTYDWEYWQGPQNEILYVSPSCERVSGYTPAEFVADPGLVDRIVLPEDRPLYKAHLFKTRSHPESREIFRILRKDGEIRWIAHGCRAVVSNTGEPRGRRVSNRDITDLKQAEQLAQQLAHFDTLTGLPNRRMLMDRLHRALAKAKRSRRPLAVMFLDVDRFKQINDTLGHDVGDRLLVEIGKRLAAGVRTEDTVSRSGGDEFVIVLPEIANASDATIVAGNLIRALGKSVRIDDHTLAVTASIGIAVHLANSQDDATELMKKADVAMYAAKQAGRNGYRVYEPPGPI